MKTEELFSDSTCTDQIRMAERELSAFISAVRELMSSQQAKLSAGDWLEESGLTNGLPGSTSRNWREVTVGGIRLDWRIG
jgi:uncharacterized protein YecA (UPF0149 family)